MSREYSKLAQNERDLESNNYIIKPDEQRKRSCCHSTFIILAVVVMFCGAIAFVIGIFFTPQVNTIMGRYLKPKSEVNGTSDSFLPSFPKNMTNSINSSIKTQEETITPLLVTALEEPLKPNITGQQTNSTTNFKTNTTTTGLVGSSESGGNSEEDCHDKYGSKERDSSEEFDGSKCNGSGENRTEHHHSHTGEILDEAEEKFASWMIKLERLLEKTTGIQRPELVVPLFMLFCFVISLSLASCCCYLMMKRRETHRRLVLGKIITDLQTGDSKAVLLGQDADD